MKEALSPIAEALQFIDLTNNVMRLRGELRTQNAFDHHGIRYAELFDGKTALKVAFDPKQVDFPDEDCEIEVEGEVRIYATRASLTLWADRWSIVGDSQFQDEVEYSYHLLNQHRKKRPRLKKIRKVLVIGPKTDSAHAIQDFLNALQRHPAGNAIEVTVRRVRMRGPEAALEIAAEIRKLSRKTDVDLYCLVSGGGDKYELDQVFAAPILVEAVCTSKLPSLVGVGHSKDEFPLNDAADWCADTPSAAGTLLGDVIREKQRQGCYLITATCGADSQEVRLFYHLRDDYLVKHLWGKILIRMYYFVSPPLAALLNRNKTLKKLSYALVVRPMYTFLRKG